MFALSSVHTTNVKRTMALTKKQFEVQKFVRGFEREHGYAPSYREIAAGLGLSSPATVFQHMKAIAGKTPVSAIALLPMAGMITAGEPIEALEERETMAVPSSFVLDEANSYILRVKGRSMIEDGIFDGDYVVIERNPSPKNGEVVVALLDNAYATLKRFYREQDRIRLQPANSTMDPIIIRGDINIQGVVRAVIRKFQPA